MCQRNKPMPSPPTSNRQLEPIDYRHTANGKAIYRHLTTTRPTTTKILITTTTTDVISTPSASAASGGPTQNMQQRPTTNKNRRGNSMQSVIRQQIGRTRIVDNRGQRNDNQRRSRTALNHRLDIGNGRRWLCGDIGDKSERTAATTLDSTENWTFRFT